MSVTTGQVHHPVEPEQPALQIGEALALLLGAALFVAAWTLVGRAPVGSALLPAAAAALTVAIRRAVLVSAPGEWYLAHDGKLWALYLAAVLASCSALLVYTLLARREPRLEIR